MNANELTEILERHEKLQALYDDSLFGNNPVLTRLIKVMLDDSQKLVDAWINS